MLDPDRTEVRRQQRVARRCRARSCSGSRGGSPWRGCSSARTSARRMQAEQPISIARAALPGAPGLRLGGGRRRRRARRHRPEVQPAVRARRPGVVRGAAAVDPDDADPPRNRRRAADEQVARQLRRRDRSARGDVREADEHPRRGDGQLLPAAPRRAASTRRAIPARPSASSRGASWSGSTATTRRRRPRPASTSVHVRREVPEDVPEVRAEPGDGGEVHLPGADRPGASASARARRAACSPRAA